MAYKLVPALERSCDWKRDETLAKDELPWPPLGSPAPLGKCTKPDLSSRYIVLTESLALESNSFNRSFTVIGRRPLFPSSAPARTTPRAQTAPVAWRQWDTWDAACPWRDGDRGTMGGMGDGVQDLHPCAWRSPGTPWMAVGHLGSSAPRLVPIEFFLIHVRGWRRNTPHSNDRPVRVAGNERKACRHA